jgi:hypothetical protein
MHGLFRVNCCWLSPAQSLLVSGPAGFMTIFFSHDRKIWEDIKANLRKTGRKDTYVTSAFRIELSRMLMVTQRFGVYYNDYLQGE